MGVRQAIAIRLPAAIWTSSGALCFFLPTEAFSGPLVGFAMRPDLVYSPVAKFGVRFASCYMMLVGGYGVLVLFFSNYELRKFWLLGQLLFCVVASVIAQDFIFAVDKETLDLYTPHFRAFIEMQKPLLKFFGLLFVPLSLMGYFEPGPKKKSQ